MASGAHSGRYGRMHNFLPGEETLIVTPLTESGWLIQKKLTGICRVRIMATGAHPRDYRRVHTLFFEFGFIMTAEAKTGRF